VIYDYIEIIGVSSSNYFYKVLGQVFLIRSFVLIRKLFYFLFFSFWQQFILNNHCIFRLYQECFFDFLSLNSSSIIELSSIKGLILSRLYSLLLNPPKSVDLISESSFDVKKRIPSTN